MVSDSVLKLTPDLIKKSFKVCAVATNGKKVAPDDLHSRIKVLINNPFSNVQNLDIPSDTENDSEDITPIVEG